MKYAATFLSSVLLALVVSCTVYPKDAQRKEPGWDATVQNGGFIGWAEDGRGIITPRAAARYTALAARYFNRFDPPIDAASALEQTSTNTFLITPQGVYDFQTMVRWSRQEPRKP